jgi:hypothetical protein
MRTSAKKTGVLRVEIPIETSTCHNGSMEKYAVDSI